eukprot:SAG31_NODE_17830_length_656_cov_1.220826_2_plen_24_part_01
MMQPLYCKPTASLKLLWLLQLQQL